MQKSDRSILVYYGGRIRLGVARWARAAGIARIAEGDWTSYDGANELANEQLSSNQDVKV